MLTLAVFYTVLLFFSVHTQALFFPAGSHNRGPSAPATGGTLTARDPPTKIIRRQTTPSSTLQPIIAVQNTTDWGAQTNQLCEASVNTTFISNPAGVYTCYNVLSFDPNTGVFIAEVRMLQIVQMENQVMLGQVTGSNILFEFPDATVTNNAGSDSLKRRNVLSKRQSAAQINVASSFLLNGTADTTKKYLPSSSADIVFPSNSC
jgi:hypothetical protein